MHRSGTSALTRVINLLGVDLGRNMMAARSDNKKGFWEQEDLVEWNDELLFLLGRRWDDVRELSADACEGEGILRCKKEIAAVLHKEFARAKMWAVKDPRLCRLFPLYASILTAEGVEVKTICVLRDPVEVAGSLYARNSMPMYYGLLLWARYVLEQEKNSRDVPRVWVRYEDLLSDWRGVVKNIEETLGVVWPVDMDAAVPLIEEFIDPDLRHQKKVEGFSGDGAALKPLVCRLYHLLRSAEDGPRLWDEMDGISGDIYRLLALFEDASSTVDDFAAFFQEKVPEVLDSRLQGAALLETRQKMDLEEVCEQVRSDLSRSQQTLQQVRDELVRSDEEIRRVRNDCREMREQRDESQRWLDYVQGCYSWKLTRPMRGGARLLQGVMKADLKLDARRISLASTMLRQHGLGHLLKQATSRVQQGAVGGKGGGMAYSPPEEP